MNPKSERVVIVGASDKPDRYAYLAFKLLRDHGHVVIASALMPVTSFGRPGT